MQTRGIEAGRPACERLVLLLGRRRGGVLGDVRSLPALSGHHGVVLVQEHLQHVPVCTCGNFTTMYTPLSAVPLLQFCIGTQEKGPITGWVNFGALRNGGASVCEPGGEGRGLSGCQSTWLCNFNLRCLQLT